jgi:PAS domain S-box-containing protein
MLDVASRIEVSSALNALDVGIILLDRQSRIVLWNDWIARVTGCPEPSIREKSIYDVMPSLRDTRVESAIADTFDAGSSSILTHSLNSKLLPLRGDGGEELLHNVVVRPVFSGYSQHCLLQINDVSIAVTRERVLRERQNARYHAIVETAPDAIITIDLDRTIQSVNSVTEHAFGYTSSDLVGQKIDILLNQNHEAAALFSEGDQQPGETSGSHQVAARRKDGAAAHFDVSSARWKSNERMFITTIWREVTERLKSEQALRESEERHRTLLQALPQLVWTCNADGECDYFNSQWQIYAGGAKTEHFGHGWRSIIHPAERQQFEADWKEALTLRTVFDSETQLRRHDGTYRWFKIRSIPMLGAASTAPTQWYGTATDITDLIEARNTLRTNNEELELRVAARTYEREVALAQLYESQKMETIGQLTGGVAHDFNNLLAVILGSLSLLKKAIPEDPRTSRLLDGALQGAERGATLTKRLLAFARRQELKLEIVEIQKLIPDALDFLRQSVGPNISIEVDIADNTKPVVIDANQLELALMNLAVNSRDAMPKGGTLTITCCNETVDQRSLSVMLAGGDYVRLSVADTGEGMNEETRLRAMDPFFTTKGVGKGTGLGLSMVHGMTAQSGGAMDVRSHPGIGTTVTLWLRQAREEDVRSVPAPHLWVPEGTEGRQLRILLVDDDALVSMNSAYMLMDLGHSVLEAHSAVHALQLLESDAAFDVVITDYAMPGMNGLDLATKLSELRPEIPVILATGYAELASTEGPIKFPRLGKPYSQEQLAEALEAVLQAGSQFDHQ